MNSFEYNHPLYVNTPYFVLQDKNLDFFNKYLFSLFWSFSVSGKKIKMSNGYISSLFQIDIKHVGKRLKQLEDLGYIKRVTKNFKRVIEVLLRPYDDIDIEDDQNPIKNTARDHDSQGLTSPPVDGTPLRLQAGPPPPTGGTDIKAYNKENTKDLNPKSLTGKRGESFCLSQMLEKNPHHIPQSVLEDWLEVRKGKRAKMTATAWEQANQNLFKLKEAGLCPIDCFKKAVASGWAGVEVRYFRQDIDALKNGSNASYPDKEERIANDIKIRERELKAQEEKRREIDASHNFKNISSQVRTRFDLNEERKRQEAERMSMGLTALEYHAVILNRSSRL